MFGVLCTGLLSAFIGLIAFFGQYMGTFVISIDDTATKLGISMADNVEYENPTSRLLVNPVNKAHPVTFQDVNFEEAINTDGDLNVTRNNNYIAFTFYVRNDGNVTVDVSLDLESLEITKKVDSAIRIAIIEDGLVDSENNITMSHSVLFMKSEENMDQVTYEMLSDKKKELYDRFEIRGFKDNDFGDYVFRNFSPGAKKKFTMIIWLEGWDKDCNDSIKQGQLKMNLTLKIVGMSDD